MSWSCVSHIKIPLSSACDKACKLLKKLLIWLISTSQYFAGLRSKSFTAKVATCCGMFSFSGSFFSCLVFNYYNHRVYETKICSALLVFVTVLKL